MGNNLQKLLHFSRGKAREWDLKALQTCKLLWHHGQGGQDIYTKMGGGGGGNTGMLRAEI